MAIPSRQIGWSAKSNLLWQISKQLEYLTKVIGGNVPATTTTTTTATPTTTTTTSSTTSTTTSTSTSTSTSTTSTTSTSTSTTTTTTTVAPTTTTTTTIQVYTIGQSALGGKIAYILQPGDPGYSASVQKGLVATTADISTGAIWGCIGLPISGATGTAIGTGNANTVAIIADCETAGIAARLCADLVQGGYSDWYLPSKNELNALYTNKDAIGGFDEFAFYWSSSQSSSTEAWYQEFFNGSQFTDPKEIEAYVRAIRSF